MVMLSERKKKSIIPQSCDKSHDAFQQVHFSPAGMPSLNPF